MKNGHSEDETFHSTSKNQNFKRVIFIMKVLPWNWLKWRGESVSKECCGCFSHAWDVYKASLGRSPFGPADIVAETRTKNCSIPFCNH